MMLADFTHTGDMVFHRVVEGQWSCFIVMRYKPSHASWKFLCLLGDFLWSFIFENSNTIK
jgi:hypothetical protein